MVHGENGFQSLHGVATLVEHYIGLMSLWNHHIVLLARFGNLGVAHQNISNVEYTKENAMLTMKAGKMEVDAIIEMFASNSMLWIEV